MNKVAPLPKFFSLQAHLSREQAIAAQKAVEAEQEYAKQVAVRVRNIQSVARSVLAKELGIFTFQLKPQHIVYLPVGLRWVLNHWRVEVSPRDIVLSCHPGSVWVPERAVVNQDLLVLSDRDIAKQVRKSIKGAKTFPSESLPQRAKMMLRKERKEAERKVVHLEHQLAEAKRVSASYR